MHQVSTGATRARYPSDFLIQLRHQPLSSRASVRNVSEMGSGDDKSTLADHISNGAIDLGLILVKALNLAPLLGITGVTEQSNTLDLGLNV